MTRLFHLFTLLFALLHVGSAAAVPFDAATTAAARPESGLVRRQTVIAGTVCAIVSLTAKVSGKDTPFNICLCTEAGVLTDDSVNRLNGRLSEIGVTAPGQLSSIQADAQITVKNTPAACAYPAHSTPVCPTTPGASVLPGGSCSFKCDSPYRACGSSCIAEGDSCASGYRRSLSAQNVDAVVCPMGLEACYVQQSMKIGSTVGWECVDTKKDIESCGGCGFPVAGRAQGEDCTAMEGVNEVACKVGRCVAKSCMRGYKVVGTACVVDEAVKTFWQRAM